MTLSDSLDRKFLLLPGHCLGMALFNLYYNYGIQKLCKARNLDQQECNQLCEYCTRKFSLWQDTAQWAWICSQGRTSRATIQFHISIAPNKKHDSSSLSPIAPPPSPRPPLRLLTLPVHLPVLVLRVCLLWFQGSPM